MNTNFKKMSVMTMCIAAVVMVFGFSGCANTTANDDEAWQVSYEEATEILGRAVDYAKVGDIDGLCNLAGARANCQFQWNDAGGSDAVPEEAPEIIDTYVLAPVQLDNGFTAAGGRVLVVGGTDGLGRPYQTEVLVFRSDDPDSGVDGLAMINAVYWSGYGIGQVGADGSGTTGPRLES